MSQLDTIRTTARQTWSCKFIAVVFIMMLLIGQFSLIAHLMKFNISPFFKQCFYGGALLAWLGIICLVIETTFRLRNQT